jgi:hypothetical protein
MSENFPEARLEVRTLSVVHLVGLALELGSANRKD